MCGLNSNLGLEMVVVFCSCVQGDLQVHKGKERT